MKSFIKFIITIIVIGVIGFIVGYLLVNGSKMENSVPEEDIKVNISGENSGDTKVEIIDSISGEVIENSGENEPVLSIPKKDIIKNIEEEIKKIESGEKEEKRDNLTLDMVSDSAKNFMKYFKQDKLGVNVRIKEGYVEIMPDTDFIENMVYYYDEKGNLILYESVSTTVGGSCKYYFKNGNSIDVVEDYEEEIEVKQEYVGDIFNRAQLIYERYLAKK